jgi:hypothetical protein
MARDRRRPRASLARGWSVFAALLAMSLLGTVLAGGAQATSNPRVLEAAAARAALPSKITNPDDIKVKIVDPKLPNNSGDENRVTRDVVVTDRLSGEAPEVNYGVFIVYQFGDDESTLTDPSDTACLQVHYTYSPKIPKGVYRCTAIVNKPGVYKFFAFVNKAAVVGTLGKRLGEASATYNINKAIVLKGESKGLKYVVEGRLFEVFLLQTHVAAASVWLLLALMTAFLAVPRLRHMLSVLTLHTLEVRRGFLQSTLWAAFLVTLGTGIYLLNTQTAYKAPFSLSKWNTITTLPYAQTYFTALYIKILIFLIMGGATVVLVMEANRRAQTAEDADGLELESDDEFWERMKFRNVDGDADDLGVSSVATEGTAATAVKAKPRVTQHAGVTSRTLWVCIGIVLGGMASVGVCVTLLKYCHELIESVAALKTLNGG